VANQAAIAIQNGLFAKKLEHEAVTRERFQRLLSPAIAEQVISGKVEVKKGGELRETTVLFTDIRGFTSMSERSQPQDIVETPLERAAATSSRELEKIDYIWKEAVRRNQWILQQAGERVQVFLRKTVGERCPCVSATHKQALNDCLVCYGTGIVGGYEGPYPILLAPDDAERRLNQGAKGINLEHVSDVFMGPAPLVSQRDFVVKINGERYSIGPVRMPTNRGMLLQQHFNIGSLDEKDIRVRVPLDGTRSLYEVGHVTPPHFASAVVTDKPNIPDERELRGRTKTWENLTY